MRWNDLSMAQKNELMGVYIKNGIKSLDEMRKHYDMSDDNVITYKQWVDAMNSKYPWLETNSEKAGYDYETYFNENYDDAVSRLTEDSPRHFTDKYKLPNHPTFSNESMYSQGPMIGGKWHYGFQEDAKGFNIDDIKNPNIIDRLQRFANGEYRDYFTPAPVNKYKYPYIYNEDRPYTEDEIYDKLRIHDDGGFKGTNNPFGSSIKDIVSEAYRNYAKENPIYTGSPLQPVEITAERLPNAGVTDDNVRRYTNAVNNGLLNLTQIPNTNLQRAVKVRQFQDEWRDTMGEVSPKVIGGLAASTLIPITLTETAPWLFAKSVTAAPKLLSATSKGINGVTSWLGSHPVTGKLIKDVVASEIGGKGVNFINKAITGNTWGQNVGNTFKWLTGWNPNNTVVGKLVTDMTNPGYYAGNFIENGINGIGEILNTKINTPRNNILHEFDNKLALSSGNGNVNPYLKKMEKSQWGDYLYDPKNPTNKVDVIDVNSSNVSEFDFPKSTIDYFEKSVFPRMLSDSDREALITVRDNGDNTNVLTDMRDIFKRNPFKGDRKFWERYNKYVGKNNIVGLYDESSGNIFVDEASIPSLEHETRHRLQDYMPRTPSEEKILSKAYKDTDDIIPGYDMNKEWETMNLDGRIALSKLFDGDEVTTNLPIEKELLGYYEEHPDFGIQKLYKADGYWEKYINKLTKDYDGPIEEWVKTPDGKKKLHDWLEAMQKVGVFGVPLGIGLSVQNKDKKILISNK